MVGGLGPCLAPPRPREPEPRGPKPPRLEMAKISASFEDSGFKEGLDSIKAEGAVIDDIRAPVEEKY